MNISVRQHDNGAYILEVDGKYLMTVPGDKLSLELALLAEKFVRSSSR